MRIALIERPEAAGYGHSRFSQLADLLRAQGHDVTVVNDAADGDNSPMPVVTGPVLTGPVVTGPILTGLNRALSARPMIEAHRLGQRLADKSFDLIIAPLCGGIAQGILMARACREAFETTRVALWCDTPSRFRFLRDGEISSGLEPLIADALERQTLALADALIGPDQARAALVSGLTPCVLPSFTASLPVAAESESCRLTATNTKEIVFVGPIERGAGVVEFIEAIQRLSRDGVLADRLVTFLGAARSGAQGIGKEWLGLQASRWPFRFKVAEATSPAELLRYVREAGRLAIAIVDDTEEFEPIRQCGQHHVAISRSAVNPESLADRVETGLRGALAGGATAISVAATPTDWAELVIRLGALPCPSPRRPAPAAGVTVCVLHHDRLPELAKAVASIPDFIGDSPVEIIVLDNASDGPFVEDEIRNRAGPRALLRIIRLTRSIPQASALNRALAEARFETVLFLDDDNYYLPTGVARLARAVALGGLDIAVTALEVFDDVASGPTPTVGRLVFLGEAHSAGLFFNAFGDTAMAVRRETFLARGGFHDPGFDYPSLDWVTLAKAQAAGLRIGALQSPAVRYRRNTAHADMRANKLDQEGARAFVFEAYGGAFDAELVARYAQKLQLEEL